MEDIDYRGSRGLDKRFMVTLAGCEWVRRQQNVLLTGPTGAGKTWLACVLGNQACRQGFSVMYVRVPRLLEQLPLTATGALAMPLSTPTRSPLPHPLGIQHSALPVINHHPEQRQRNW